MATKELEVRVKGTDNASQTFKGVGVSAEQAARKVKELEKAAAAAGAGGSGGGGSGGKSPKFTGEDGLKDLASSLGSKKLLSRIMGGGVAGYVGSELDATTAHLKQISTQLKGQKAEWREIALNAAESLPIFGHYVTAGQNIKDIIGEWFPATKKWNYIMGATRSEIEAINKATEKQNQLLLEQFARSLKIKAEQKEVAAIQAKGQRDTGLIFMTGLNKDLQAATNEHLDALDSLQAKRQAILDKNANEKYKEQQSIDPKDKNALRNLDEKYKRMNLEDTRVVNAQIEAENTKAAGKLYEINDKAGKDANKALAEHANATRDLQMQAWEARLKANDEGFVAEMAQIKEQARQKKDALEKQLKEQLLNAPAGYQSSLKQAAAEQARAIDAAAGEEARALAKKRQEEIQKSLISGQQRALQENVNAATTGSGRLAANKQLAGFNLRADFNSRKKDLIALINDPSASPAEKAMAVAQLQSFVSNSGALFDAATLGSQPAANHLAGASSSVSLTGLGAAARERGDIELAKQTAQNTKDGAAAQKDMQRMFTELMNLLRPKLQTASGTQSIFD